VPLFGCPAVVASPGRSLSAPDADAPAAENKKTLEALLTWLLALTEQQPVLFVVEDLHWIDPSTLEFLTLLVEQGPTARLLTLLTCRARVFSRRGVCARISPPSRCSACPSPRWRR